MSIKIVLIEINIFVCVVCYLLPFSQTKKVILSAETMWM